MRYSTNDNQQLGFTLIELVLVVAMIGLIAMFSVTLGVGFLWRTDLSQAQFTSVVSLRLAQALARAGMNDEGWGVHIEENQLTIFEGNDFDNRDTEMDEEYDLGSVTVSAPIDVVYYKFSGLPYENSSLINLMTMGESATISVNSEGIIDY